MLLDFGHLGVLTCRASFPTIAKIHEQYKGKPYQLIVSLDKDQKHGKALNEEGCTWTQVCDLKGNC